MKDFFERYVRKEWKLKLLSIVLAMMLWYTVSEVGEPKKDISVAISVNNLAKDLVVMKTDPEKVTVTVSGRVSLLKDIKDSDIRLQVNLNGSKEGENIFNLMKKDIIIPRGLEVEDIKPSSVKVVVDRIIEKKLKTIVRLDKRLNGKYSVISWSPQHVTAEGPRKTLEKVTVIETLPAGRDPAGGDLHRNEETVNAGLDMENLPRVHVRPDAVKIILKRQSGKETIWN